jgi:etoposide-induced 2.4 mRNA
VCSDAEVRANALKSFLLNGISLLSIYVFELLVHPLSRVEDGADGAGRVRTRNGLHQSVGLFYRVLWLLPVLGVSLYLNVRNLHAHTHTYICHPLGPSRC